MACRNAVLVQLKDQKLGVFDDRCEFSSHYHTLLVRLLCLSSYLAVT